MPCRAKLSRSFSMENYSNELTAFDDLELSSEPLISGLPDDIALFCVARVPLKYHAVLRCVSKRWRNLVCSEEWHLHRRKHNLEETLIYALCRDKILDQVCCYVLNPSSSRRSWKLIQGIPAQSFKRKGMAFQTLGKNLYLLGGCSWSEEVTDEVYCYDPSKNFWSKASPLPYSRCYFACEVVHGKIFAIGGLGSKSSDPCSWDVYDPQTNSWTSHVDSNLVVDIEDSIVLDGKIYIRCGQSGISSHVYVVVYDPSSGTWQHADADLASGWLGPAVVINDILYVLDQSSGTKLTMWKKETREWAAIGRLSPHLTRPPCRLVTVDKSIYVVGKGLSTVVFDVSGANNIERVIVSSSIPNLNSDHDIILSGFKGGTFLKGNKGFIFHSEIKEGNSLQVDINSLDAYTARWDMLSTDKIKQ
ncbi:hypothetical protein V2J09_008461 [Rumex salicifolius]